MASLGYLWQNRAKFPINSIAFYRAWAKRIVLLPDVYKKNRRYRKLVRSGANISKLAEIGEASINGNKNFLTVGDQTFIGKARLAITKPIKIGNNVCINDDVVIMTGSHDIFDPKWPNIRAEIKIDDYAWIGTGAMILKGVHIGRGAVVGARAVVSKNVEPGEIVVGNPAKPLKKKRDIEFDYSPCEFIAANRAWLKG